MLRSWGFHGACSAQIDGPLPNRHAEAATFCSQIWRPLLGPAGLVCLLDGERLQVVCSLWHRPHSSEQRPYYEGSTKAVLSGAKPVCV